MGNLSLFSGCGGCSLGLKKAGLSVNLAVDIDKDACDTYSANLGKGTTWCTDLSKVTAKELLERSRLRQEEVNLIVGGPPCQGFSSAGAKDWTDPRNALIRKFVDTVIELKPIWFIMENVEGLLTANNGLFFIEATTRFLEAGYWVRAKKVYMENYGLPQRRKRVLIVGNLERCNFDFPEQTHFVQPALFNPGRQLQINIMDAISDLPAMPNVDEVCYSTQPQNDYQQRLRRLDDHPVRHNQIKTLNATMLQRIAHLKQGETMKHLPEELQHPSYTRRSYRRVMDGTPTEKRGGAPSGLKRLIANDPSLTITSGSSAEFIHPILNRPLTLRECARIQTFPDWFDFQGSWSSVATQIGNAIPPMFMEILTSHILKSATWHRQENSRGCWLGIDATKSNGKSPILITMLTELKERTNAFSYA
ncbi:MAG: DNA cytosine methyltransferase [Ktedonobacteraceae bacterium]|nr:DNA cytosine methyltransferase [Chloroflexota bacterium]